MPVVSTLNNTLNEMAKMINETSRNFSPSFGIKEDKNRLSSGRRTALHWPKGYLDGTQPRHALKITGRTESHIEELFQDNKGRKIVSSASIVKFSSLTNQAVKYSTV
jgi:hypothetical protein